MSEQNVEAELKFLREECERLRKERDLARKEQQDAAASSENESSIRLKLLAESLSREVKDRFLGSLKNALWAATLLIGIATAGGLWKLSDIVAARVDEKIKEKEKDVAQVRQQIIQAVVDFERQAQKSLEDIEKLRTQVARESDQATGEIRQAKARILSLEISSQGEKVTISAAAPEGSGISAMVLERSPAGWRQWQGRKPTSTDSKTGKHNVGCFLCSLSIRAP